jgi:tRNA dimethylallyltransferase
MVTKKPNSLPSAIFIMGPTASGKTDLAMALRQYLPVDIISVDSAQIYRNLDIGSAKADAATLRKHPHRMIDIRDPSHAYSVAEFVVEARQHMANITAAGRIPLLVGGTMLSFKMLFDGLSDLPEADQKVRQEIQLQADSVGWGMVYRELQKVDPLTASKLHPNHSQRIQRALEVYKLTGVPLSTLQLESRGMGVNKDYNVVQIAMMASNRTLLHARIEERFHCMIEQGLLAEVQSLYHRGDLTLDLPSIRAAGYQQLWRHLNGEYSLDDAVQKAIFARRQLAKRQITWLKKWSGSHEVYIDDQKRCYSSGIICNESLKIFRQHLILPALHTGMVY